MTRLNADVRPQPSRARKEAGLNPRVRPRQRRTRKEAGPSTPASRDAAERPRAAELHPRRAMSLVEVVVATGVVGVMFVAAIGMVGASRKGEFFLDERARGGLLAEGLMGEILQQAYEDPQEPPGGFGLEAADSSAGKRTLFDDVDDYHNWSASPPQAKDGTAIAWATDYKTSVTVDWVKTTDVTAAAGSDSGIKRIVVTVTRADREVARLTAWRTDAWRDPGGLGK